jgi:hypothetical protein
MESGKEPLWRGECAEDFSKNYLRRLRLRLLTEWCEPVGVWRHASYTPRYSRAHHPAPLSLPTRTGADLVYHHGVGPSQLLIKWRVDGASLKIGRPSIASLLVKPQPISDPCVDCRKRIWSDAHMVARIEARDLRASMLEQELHVIRAEHGVALTAISAVCVNSTGSRSGPADNCYRYNIYVSK